MSARPTIFHTALAALGRSKPKTLAQRVLHKFRNAQNTCATPPPRTRSGRMPGRPQGAASKQSQIDSSCAASKPSIYGAEDMRLYSKTRVQTDAITALFLARNCVAKRHSSGRAERPAASAESPERPSRPNSLRGRVVAIAVTVCSMLFLAATPQAFALSKHTFSNYISGEGTSALSNPADVAVEESSGDVYVSDPANHRVEKFDSAGHFILMLGSEVNKTAVEEGATRASEENVCPAAGHPSDECQPGTAGPAPGAFEGSGGHLFLAVDNSTGPSVGDLYVGDPGDSLVQKFGPDGNLIPPGSTAASSKALPVERRTNFAPANLDRAFRDLPSLPPAPSTSPAAHPPSTSSPPMAPSSPSSAIQDPTVAKPMNGLKAAGDSPSIKRAASSSTSSKAKVTASNSCLPSANRSAASPPASPTSP